MRAYQQVLDEIEALGGQLVAVSPEAPDNTLSTAEKNAVRFEVLSDAGNAVARTYGLAFQLADVLIPIYTDFGIDLPSHNDADAWELPIPGTFVLDRDGTVRLAFVDADYTTRLEPAAILDALRSLR